MNYVGQFLQMLFSISCLSTDESKQRGNLNDWTLAWKSELSKVIYWFSYPAPNTSTSFLVQLAVKGRRLLLQILQIDFQDWMKLVGVLSDEKLTAHQKKWLPDYPFKTRAYEYEKNDEYSHNM